MVEVNYNAGNYVLLLFHYCLQFQFLQRRESKKEREREKETERRKERRKEWMKEWMKKQKI